MREDFFKQPEELVVKLAGRCHRLETRRDILSMTEEAEKLAEKSTTRSSDEVAREAHLLKNRIDLFLQNHSPSPEDVELLKFAKLCINQVNDSDQVLFQKISKIVPLNAFQKKEPSEDAFELAETLYTLAGTLYQGDVVTFQEAYQTTFSKEIQQEIGYHIFVSQGDPSVYDTGEARLKIVQGLLGYAHLVTGYYTDETPYPTFTQIHEMFEDLAFINYIEESDLS